MVWVINYERVEDYANAAKRGEFKPIYLSKQEIVVGDKPENQKAVSLVRLTGKGEALHFCQRELIRAEIPKTPDEYKMLMGQVDVEYRKLINDLNVIAPGVEKQDGEVSWR